MQASIGNEWTVARCGGGCLMRAHPVITHTSTRLGYWTWHRKNNIASRPRTVLLILPPLGQSYCTWSSLVWISPSWLKAIAQASINNIIIIVVNNHHRRRYHYHPPTPVVETWLVPSSRRRIYSNVREWWWNDILNNIIQCERNASSNWICLTSCMTDPYQNGQASGSNGGGGITMAVHDGHSDIESLSSMNRCQMSSKWPGQQKKVEEKGEIHLEGRRKKTESTCRATILNCGFQVNLLLLVVAAAMRGYTDTSAEVVVGHWPSVGEQLAHSSSWSWTTLGASEEHHIITVQRPACAHFTTHSPHISITVKCTRAASILATIIPLFRGVILSIVLWYQSTKPYRPCSCIPWWWWVWCCWPPRRMHILTWEFHQLEATTPYKQIEINKFVSQKTKIFDVWQCWQFVLWIDDHRYNDFHNSGAQKLNRIITESFLLPILTSPSQLMRGSRRRSFSNIPSAIGRVVRGVTNLTVTIGRTINSENVNGSLSRLITSRLVGVSESLMGWVERSVDDLPSIPRLDAQECMKRCICEAHNQPKKYGAVGLVIQLFFP